MTLQYETPRILVRDYDLKSMESVFSYMDHSDLVEAAITRGDPGPVSADKVRHFMIDWHNANALRLLSLVACRKRQMGALLPFAIFGVSLTGYAGVAQAALLARAHFVFRRDLAELAILIRKGLPEWAAEHGINRIEARSWAGHPTGGGFLRAIGFDLECTMPGFGAGGMETFEQYARHFPREQEI